MHLSGCIFILAMTLLGTSSVTIKMMKGHKCLKGLGESSYKMAPCDPYSQSQNWTVDGGHIKHNVLKKCLVDGSITDENLVNLVPCEFTPSANKRANDRATKDRKLRIDEDKILRNYQNECLFFGSKSKSTLFWSDCVGYENNIAIVT
jgi:hypothetical protein